MLFFIHSLLGEKKVWRKRIPIDGVIVFSNLQMTSSHGIHVLKTSLWKYFYFLTFSTRNESYVERKLEKTDFKCLPIFKIWRSNNKIKMFIWCNALNLEDRHNFYNTFITRKWKMFQEPSFLLITSPHEVCKQMTSLEKKFAFFDIFFT